jgi:excisionase family DNA binding protein
MSGPENQEPKVEWLTADDLAERLQLSPFTVRTWARQRIIPGSKLGGKVWRFRWDVVNEAMRNLETKAHAEGGEDGCEDGGTRSGANR